MGQEKTLTDRSKQFSDFLGFHVRLFFCASLAQVAAAIPVSNVLSDWQAGTEYQASEHLPELAVMLLFMAYAVAMYVFIISTGWRYIGNIIGKLWLRRTLGLALRLMFVAVQSLAIAAVLVFSTLQIFALFGIENLSDAECIVNAYLSDTNYTFTPDKPAHCP
ncbi:hypothetical protein J7443_10650 [Tropicibacter sp. R15_0]|uniref:hypothetical protein n=1 Tax=Tropicibacter sp. R15_0 TaxID=2821101 RepID=UPI001ADBECDD|nr:hypothetical protein [Tropicibacter sp. R15_0]MBO9465688.1 hypothetical protein [Tropicibacter sp. R15_0]